MKQLSMTLAACLLIATTFTSCKKDYKCQCSKTYTTGTGTNTSNYSVYTYHENRSRAETRCSANADSGSDLFGNYSINCEIQ